MNVGYRVNDLGKAVLTEGVIKFLRPNVLFVQVQISVTQDNIFATC